jgi:hypothetical protein
MSKAKGLLLLALASVAIALGIENRRMTDSTQAVDG